MAYYDALKAEWATLTGTIAEKLAAVNAATVAGPNVDVTVPQIVGYLLLNGAYLPVSAFAQGATTGNATHDAALAAAKTLMAAITVPNAPTLRMSDPSTYAIIKGMADAVLAQETASPGSTGFTQAVHNGLLALAATTVPWWQANGYASPLNGHDLVAAGLTTLTTSAATPPGGNVLTFTAVPSWLVVGMEVHDLGLDQADIPPGTTVEAVSPTSVTMTSTATGSGIAAGDSIGFV